uniref:Uncharacterized protein n=1 Tax=Tetradesmus obliquus TaxID=3088 RepID=A0A383V5S8_TETOB|eukprot:jgi/Sobl393_1/15035/SZX60313.1
MRPHLHHSTCTEPKPTPTFPKPLTQPITTPIPITLPITQPLPITITLPITQPVTLPITKSLSVAITQPITQPVTLPITKSLSIAITQPITQPVTITQPLALPITKPVTQPITVPLAQPEPVTKPVSFSQPVTITIPFTFPFTFPFTLTIPKSFTIPYTASGQAAIFGQCSKTFTGNPATCPSGYTGYPTVAGGGCGTGNCGGPCCYKTACSTSNPCPTGKCCCNVGQLSNGVQLTECVTEQINCEFTCSQNTCNKFGRFCNCISSCGGGSGGGSCSSVGGNPCSGNGNCCCGGPPGVPFVQACPTCRDPCQSGGNTKACVGDLGTAQEALVCDATIA